MFQLGPSPSSWLLVHLSCALKFSWSRWFVPWAWTDEELENFNYWRWSMPFMVPSFHVLGNPWVLRLRSWFVVFYWVVLTMSGPWITKDIFPHNLSSVKFSLNPLLPTFEHSADTSGCSFVDFTLVCLLSVVEITPFSSESETGCVHVSTQNPQEVNAKCCVKRHHVFNHKKVSSIKDVRDRRWKENMPLRGYLCLDFPMISGPPVSVSALFMATTTAFSVSCLFIAAQVYFKVGCKLFLYFLIH